MNETNMTFKLARGQVGMLGTAFLLGMAVNLIGLPDETTGGAKTATSILLGLHGLVGLGLLVGAIRVWQQTMKANSAVAMLGRMGGISIIITLIAGVLTLSTKSNWWSYLMALGFIAAFFIYGRLLLRSAVH